MKNEVLDAVKKELSLYGIVPRVENGGKHLKIFWHAKGHLRSQIIATTPSDYRAALNERAATRRMLRADGFKRVEEAPKPPVKSLASALSLPDPIPPVLDRVTQLEERLTILTDMLLELQQQPEPTVQVSVMVNGKPVITAEPIPKPVKTYSFDKTSVPKGDKPTAERRRAKRAGELSDFGKSLLEVLEVHRPQCTKELAEAVGRRPNHTSTVLGELAAMGLAEKVGWGYWRKKAAEPVATDEKAVP